MSANTTHFDNFITAVKSSQKFWALHDQATDGWVILDSINFENTDVMPVWSKESVAKSHCSDEWQDYVPVMISVGDWLEFWVEDLAEDNVMIGVDWQDEEYLEVELAEFSQKIAEIEAF